MINLFDVSSTAIVRSSHQETCHLFFGLVRARTSLYELKSRKVDEEHRIRKNLIPKLIFRRSETQKKPLFLFFFEK